MWLDKLTSREMNAVRLGYCTVGIIYALNAPGPVSRWIWPLAAGYYVFMAYTNWEKEE